MKGSTEQQSKPIGYYIQRQTCRFCEEKRLKQVLDFGLMPLAGGFLKKHEFSEEKFYPLDLNFCEDCFLVQVSNVVPADTLFRNYFYFSSSIKTLVTHCADFAKEVKDRFLRDTDHAAILEIGCNDGVMLKSFATMGVKAIGVDPATNVVNSVEDKTITIINDFFTEGLAIKLKQQYGPFDAIVSSYSFAHIDNIISVIKGVKTLLKPKGAFIFEVYYLGTLLDEMQYDMIYHEHLSYYSLKALSIFLEKYDMEIFDVKYTPGVRSGAVRFYAQFKGKGTNPIAVAVLEMQQREELKGYNEAATFVGFGRKVNATRVQLMELLNRLKKEGKMMIGYGASGRGTTMMNYCGIDGQYLDYVVDDAPAKHGFYTPGTHVAIKPWDYTKGTMFPEYALLFAWSFVDEVKKKRADYLKQGGHFIIPLPEVQVVSYE